jgi:hypothetical protein
MSNRVFGLLAGTIAALATAAVTLVAVPTAFAGSSGQQLEVTGISPYVDQIQICGLNQHNAWTCTTPSATSGSQYALPNYWWQGTLNIWEWTPGSPPQSNQEFEGHCVVPAQQTPNWTYCDPHISPPPPTPPQWVPSPPKGSTPGSTTGHRLGVNDCTLDGPFPKLVCIWRAQDIQATPSPRATSALSCNPATYHRSAYRLPVLFIVNGCSTRLWLHQHTNGSGLTYCMSGDVANADLLGAGFMLQNDPGTWEASPGDMQVSRNPNLCGVTPPHPVTAAMR